MSGFSGLPTEALQLLCAVRQFVFHRSVRGMEVGVCPQDGQYGYYRANTGFCSIKEKPLRHVNRACRRSKHYCYFNLRLKRNHHV